MNEEPVAAEEYDEAWLESAWGSAANQALLTGEPIQARPRVQRAIELACLKPGLRLLDIACGRGEFVALAAYAGAEAHGIDFSRDALKFAERVNDAHGPNLPDGGSMHFQHGDATCLPFDDGSFDCITLLDIIEHLNDEQLIAMFGEIQRVLSPGGVVVLHTLPNRWVYDLTFPLLHRLSSRFPANPRGPFDSKVHINEQSVPQLAQMLDRCGFSHKLWLEQHMASQARWSAAAADQYGDNRDNLYPMLSGNIGRVLEWVSLTPFKLLLSNDIFGLAWKQGETIGLPKTPLNLTESLAVSLFPHKA